jgi:uncharacterized protein
MTKMVVIGASLNPLRFSYQTVKLLIKYKFDVVSIGIRHGYIENCPILFGKPSIYDVHTVLLYLRPEKQKDYYNYIVELNPKRVIFNPGAENTEFSKMLNKKDIEVVYNCSLIMLNSENF